MRAQSLNTSSRGNRSRWSAWGLFLWLIMTLASAGFSTLRAAPAYRPDRILIKPRTVEDPEERKALGKFHAGHGVRVRREFHRLNGIQELQLPPGTDVPGMIRRYELSGLVEFAEPD